MNITKIPAKLPKKINKIKVAAYARVSSKSDDQLHSLEAQIDYYKKEIKRHVQWTFVGVFVDGGISGTKKDRPGLEELLSACRKGEVNLVLTKSISRFARNTVDLLTMIRELKELEIAVYFEREKINTLTADGELMLTLLASFAQEESRSISLNTSWSIQKRFAKGKLVGMAQLFGYEVKAEQLIIHPKEAETVRMIYENYLSGMNSSEIAEKLNLSGKLRKHGGQWKAKDIVGLFRNEKHTGNALLNKSCVLDPISKKSVRNRGERPRYYVENSHEGIIPKELYDAVQNELKSRTSGKKSNQQHNKPFRGRIVCSACGAMFQRKKTPVRVFWRCGTTLCSKSGHCHMKGIPEETLEQMCCDIFQLECFDPEIVHDKVEKIISSNANKLTFNLKGGSTMTKTWQERSRAESWTDEMRASAGQKTKERFNHVK